MSALTPELTSQVVAACQAGAQEAAAVLSRNLGQKFSVEVGTADSYNPASVPEGFDGPGLVISFQFGAQAAVAVLPETSGLIPDWYANPDATGMNKLDTLAQELGTVLMPEAMTADRFEAARVERIQQSLAHAQLADDVPLVPLVLKVGDNQGQLSLLWPLAAPGKLFESEAADQFEEEKSAPAPATTGEQKSVPVSEFSQLPCYSRSLLMIRVPVRVELAAKKERMSEVLELAQGKIIQFEKACDEPLLLYVSNQLVAQGEAIKFGDKFGFRVTSMEMPKEHFMRLQMKKAS